MKKAIIITATALTFSSVLTSPLQVLAAQATEKVESSQKKTPRVEGVAVVTTSAEFIAAAKNTTINEIQLGNDITLTSKPSINHPIVINGLNHVLDMKGHTIGLTNAATSLHFKDINLLNGQGGEVGTLNLAGTILANGSTDVIFENTTHVGKELVNARTKTLTFKGQNTFTNTGSTEYMAAKNVVVDDGASVLIQGSKNVLWDAPIISLAYGGNGTFKMGANSSFKIDNPGRGPALGRVWVESNDLDVYLGANSKLDLNSTTSSYTDSHALTFTKLIGNEGAEFKAYSNNADAIKAIRGGSTIDLSQTKFDIKTNNKNKNATNLTGTSTITFDNKEVSSWTKGLVDGNPTQTWKNVKAVATSNNNKPVTVNPSNVLGNFDLSQYGRISGSGEAVTNEKPVIDANNKEITVGDSFDPMAGVTATDKEDGDLTSSVTVKSNNVDTSKPGTYDVVYTVTDSDGNTTEKTITVTVKEKASNEKPVIDANNKEITVGDSFDPMAGVTATDKEDGDLTSSVTVKSNNVDTSKPGTYDVVYTVTDSDGNTTEKTITVTVKEKASNEKPVIDANNKEITVGDSFDPMAGVTATDKEDGDLTSSVTVKSNNVDTSKPGTYDVVYTVTDSDGNTTEKTITVTVKEKATQGTITPLVYTEGDRNITGTFTGDVVTAKLYVDGEYRSAGGTFENGEFTYYAQAQDLKVGQTVYLVAFDKNGKELDRKPVQIKAPDTKGTITPLVYTEGDRNITGTFTGDVVMAKLYVDGEYRSAGGAFENGEFTYYAQAQDLKVGQTVYLVAFDKNGKELDRKPVQIKAPDTKGTITPLVYTEGDRNITGTFTGDVVTAKLFVDGEYRGRGGAFENGEFTYYAQTQDLKVGQTVYLVALDKNGKELDRKPVQIKAPDTKGTITPVEYTMGDANITGTYTGDVTYAKLKVNGEYVGNPGGSFENGQFEFYAKNKFKATDNVVIEAYDKFGKLLDSKTVQINDAISEGTITPAEYTIGDSNITGTYTGDVTYAKLKVNGEYVGTAGGKFTNGQFEYYAKNKFTEKDDVVIEAYNSQYKLLDSQKVTVKSNIQLKGEFTEATYKIGETSIKGRFTGDIQYAKVYVNGIQLQAIGGSFNAESFSFYVGNNANIKVGDIVKIEGYNNLQPNSPLDTKEVEIIE
ncbi:immunoglobulin-like domain-containing protein [Listeria aquatica]|uniref:immunoglobulin-like domain-containing protein n=1 Tax=Listeria aquatica TaxID=1494960 RepID=UPI003F722178